jgi:hypothetical protein
LNIQHKLEIIKTAATVINTPITTFPVAVYVQPGDGCGVADDVLAWTLVGVVDVLGLPRLVEVVEVTIERDDTGRVFIEGARVVAGA